MFLVHVLTALLMSASNGRKAQAWVPFRPAYPVNPYYRPGWNPYWQWNPYWRPQWITPYWQPMPWGSIGWGPAMTPGVWQCVAFGPYGNWARGFSYYNVNQAAYNALWACGGYAWQSCYIPPGYCQLYP